MRAKNNRNENDEHQGWKQIALEVGVRGKNNINRSIKSEEWKRTNDRDDAMEEAKVREWGQGMGVGRKEVGRWIWEGR